MLIWIDLETTGLDPRTCDVLEVACIATNDSLTEQARFERVVYSPLADVALRQRTDFRRPTDPYIDPVVWEMHSANGLWRESRHGENIATVDRDLAEFIEKYATSERVRTDPVTGEGTRVLDPPQLAGSTVSFDRSFLEKHAPLSAARLHYRSLDVSSLNEVARRFWLPTYDARPRGASAHRAMADISASIECLRHYLRELVPAERVAAMFGAEAGAEGRAA